MSLAVGLKNDRSTIRENYLTYGDQTAIARQISSTIQAKSSTVADKGRSLNKITRPADKITRQSEQKA